MSLPILQLETALVRALQTGTRAIIQAPTGSGKSTHIPQMLLDHGVLGEGRVVVLQPRRLAARMLAAYVARLRGGRLGDEVGYQIRFDDCSGPRTRIQYVTEGILLRRMQTDPTLPGVTALIFDEFHERHLYGDLSLARAVEVQATQRPDLKLLVMSATLATAPLAAYLQPCEVLTAEGRLFPVAVSYLDRAPPAATPVWELAARETARWLQAEPEGDALIFMPGGYEIGRTIQALQATPAGRACTLLPLHGELAPRDQDAAMLRYDKRKIVVATNVAETSLTIDGIRLVVDSGLARVARFDPYRGINTLLIENISRASTDQRAGRAGRTAPGHCARLWTAREHEGRPLQETPEIKRLDLAEAVLTLKASGVCDLAAFRWFEPPEPRVLARAEQLLCDLGAVEERTGALTALGRRMAAFPVHPRYARMILAAADCGCVRDVALLAALTQGKDMLVRRGGGDTADERETRLGEETESDFFARMRAWRYAESRRFDLEACRRLGIHAAAARQALPAFDYFLRIARQHGLPVTDEEGSRDAIRRCVLAGFIDQLARRCDAGSLRCLLVHGRKGELDRGSVVRKSPLLVAAEVREIERAGGDLRVTLSLATAVEEAWLQALFPEAFTVARQVFYDTAIKRVVAEEQRRFRDLVLEARRTGQPQPDEAARLLTEEVLAGRLKLDAWDDAVEQWWLRVACVSRWCPELGLTPLTPEERRALLQQICLGAYSGKELKERPVWPAVHGWFSAAQQAGIERNAPERLALPGGRSVKVRYALDAPPAVAARIQDLYRVTGGLAVAGGRVPVLIQVLAPNQRPVQITQDLTGFWRDRYPALKRELQKKYPKHEWR